MEGNRKIWKKGKMKEIVGSIMNEENRMRKKKS